MNWIFLILVFLKTVNLPKPFPMALRVEDLDDVGKYRQILALSYDEMITFIIDYVKRKSLLSVLYWSVCFIFLLMAISIRIRISGFFPHSSIILHSILGIIVFPLVSVPFHEGLHIIPYYLSGARKIKVGMDLNQYIFYVTAHRHVATHCQFRVVAIIPFIVISAALLFCVLMLPGLWKWSFVLFLLTHATMCAGDFALLNFYFLNKKKKIYTWDDADKKVAYFYEEF
jgi:hypothetical protein